MTHFLPRQWIKIYFSFFFFSFSCFSNLFPPVFHVKEADITNERDLLFFLHFYSLHVKEAETTNAFVGSFVGFSWLPVSSFGRAGMLLLLLLLYYEAENVFLYICTNTYDIAVKAGSRIFLVVFFFYKTKTLVPLTGRRALS